MDSDNDPEAEYWRRTLERESSPLYTNTAAQRKPGVPAGAPGGPVLRDENGRPIRGAVKPDVQLPVAGTIGVWSL